MPGESLHGAKRRRLDDQESEEDKETKLRRKLHHAFKGLRKVVKKVKTFEIQRTLKKLKDARNKGLESDVVKDMRTQMEVLKHLGYDQLAYSALATKLKKDKTFSAEPSVQALLAELVSNPLSPGAPGAPTAKVRSRILSSKVLASEVVSVVETLRTLLHASDGSEDIDIAGATDNTRPSPNTAKRRKIETGREKDALSFKGDSAKGSKGGRGNASGDDAIAEVDDGWTDMPSETDESATGSADDRDSDDAVPGRGGGDGTEDPRSKEYRSKGESELLPSLSVGFARGDSGSDFSDGETRLVDDIRKNRRGQRARRAIWEKKFGKNANHLKKSRKIAAVRGDDVDRRPGKGNRSFRPDTPVQSHAYRKSTFGASKGIKESGSAIKRIQRPSDLREKQGEQSLHPSWEAKRKQKPATIVPSQGTKIVFSEP